MPKITEPRALQRRVSPTIASQLGNATICFAFDMHMGSRVSIVSKIRRSPKRNLRVLQNVPASLLPAFFQPPLSDSYWASIMHLRLCKGKKGRNLQHLLASSLLVLVSVESLVLLTEKQRAVNCNRGSHQISHVDQKNCDRKGTAKKLPPYTLITVPWYP